MKTGRQVNMEADAAYHEQPSVTLERLARVDSLPLAAKRLGDFAWGRNSVFEPREAGRQAPC